MEKPVLVFNKRFRNENYEILFNSYSGLEITQGINGNEDPFSLELPSLLDIGIMGTCFHKCPFCYQGHINNPNMTLENFKTIIDQTKHHVNQVALGGRGDPNKHPQFKEIIEYCRKNGIVPNYTTSGIDLTDEEVEISKLCGSVAVSDYEQKYSFNAMNKFINAGIKTNIHVIFSSATYHKCKSIVGGFNPWKEQIINSTSGRREGSYLTPFEIDKINAIIFLKFKPQGAGSEMRELIPNAFHLKTFAQMVLNSKRKVGMDSCMINHVLRYATPTEFQKMSMDTCEGARASAYITPDMKLTPCSFADKNKAVQITNDNDIYKIWNDSEIFKRFREQLFEKIDHCPLNL